MLTLETPLGPVPWVPRDFKKMPRNHPSTTRTKPELLLGTTHHYGGGSIRDRYKNAKTFEEIFAVDEAYVAYAIRVSKSSVDSQGNVVSDAGYQSFAGRSGVFWEGRGFDWRNAANAKLRPDIRDQYPRGTTHSNKFWQSIFLCVGLPTDGEYAEATDVQWESTKRMNAYIQARFNIQNYRAIGHRDVCQTACPGNVVYPRLGELVPGFSFPPLPPIPPTGCECAAAIARAKLERLVLGAGFPGTSQAQQDAVYWLQHGLNRQMPAHVTPLKLDHKFGPKTQASVIAFQKVQLADDIAHNRKPRMIVDGIVYAQTWGRLYP
jgi:hypothetical protein